MLLASYAFVTHRRRQRQRALYHDVQEVEGSLTTGSESSRGDLPALPRCSATAALDPWEALRSDVPSDTLCSTEGSALRLTLDTSLAAPSPDKADKVAGGSSASVPCSEGPSSPPPPSLPTQASHSGPASLRRSHRLRVVSQTQAAPRPIIQLQRVQPSTETIVRKSEAVAQDWDWDVFGLPDLPEVRSTRGDPLSGVTTQVGPLSSGSRAPRRKPVAAAAPVSCRHHSGVVVDGAFAPPTDLLAGPQRSVAAQSQTEGEGEGGGEGKGGGENAKACAEDGSPAPQNACSLSKSNPGDKEEFRAASPPAKLAAAELAHSDLSPSESPSATVAACEMVAHAGGARPQGTGAGTAASATFVDVRYSSVLADREPAILWSKQQFSPPWRQSASPRAHGAPGAPGVHRAKTVVADENLAVWYRNKVRHKSLVLLVTSSPCEAAERKCFGLCLIHPPSATTTTGPRWHPPRAIQQAQLPSSDQSASEQRAVGS